MDIFCKVIGEFTDNFIMPTLQFDIESSSYEKVKEEDGIYNYTTALMTDCLVVEEFSDAIREGDGESFKCGNFYCCIFVQHTELNMCLRPSPH